jgi:hypothetical protein
MANGEAEGWRWSSDSMAVQGEAVGGVVRLEIDRLANASGSNSVTLVVPKAERQHLVVESLVDHLELKFDTEGDSLDLDSLDVQGPLTNLDLVSPLWPYDPTEMGLLQIVSLNIGTVDRLRLGGDELIVHELRVGWIPPLAEQNLSNKDQWNRLAILEDSRVTVLDPPQYIQVQLLDRSFLYLEGRARLQLGGIGLDSELTAPPGSSIEIVDWKVEQCSGEERIHLTGIEPFNYGLLRRVGVKVEDRPRIIGTYEPTRADKPPLDETKSPAVVSDWVRQHEALLGTYCASPRILADARWLNYEDRRRCSPFGSGERVGLSMMRLFGYGHKTGPPLALWLLMVTGIVGIYCWQAGLGVDLNGGFEAWRQGALLWIEGLTLPASFLSLAPATSNSVLSIDGTALRVARLAVSLPFAAYLFALQARLRLPKLSDSRI